MALIIMPALVLGLIIGIYEAILLHRDVTIATHRFGHMIHALFFAVVATFATMNAEYVVSLLPFLQSIPFNPVLSVQILVGVIMMAKTHGVSAVIKSSGSAMGLKETWFHSALIAALVVAAPYVWPLIEPIAPDFMK